MKTKVKTQSELLFDKYHACRNKQNEIEQQRKLEADKEYKKEYYPRLEEVEKIKDAIDEVIDAKYKKLSKQNELEQQQLKQAYEAQRVKEGHETNEFHKHGTIVTFYEPAFGGELRQTDKKGIVQIYDRTQKTPDNQRNPSIGRLVIFFLKKDGSMSSKYDEIRLDYHPTGIWLADGETPDNNLMMKLVKKHRGY